MTSFDELQTEFRNKYEHLRRSEYLNTDLELEIPKELANEKLKHVKKDLMGETVSVGDVVITGHGKYNEIKICLVVGYTVKKIRIMQLYPTGLCYPEFIEGSFIIFRKKSYKIVE